MALGAQTVPRQRKSTAVAHATHLVAPRLLLHAPLLLLGLEPGRVLPGELEGEEVGRDHVVDLALRHPHAARLRHERLQPRRARLVHARQVQLHAPRAQVRAQAGRLARARPGVVGLGDAGGGAHGFEGVRLRLLLPHALPELRRRRCVARLRLRDLCDVALAAGAGTQVSGREMGGLVEPSSLAALQDSRQHCLARQGIQHAKLTEPPPCGCGTVVASPRTDAV